MLNKRFNENIKSYEARGLMVKNVVTLSNTENLWKAHNIMSKFRIKKIVVISQGKKAQKQPIGIVTLKDIIKFLIADKTDRDLDEIPISEVMNKHLIMAKKDTAITECAKILTSNNVSSVIIVDDNNNNNNLAGIITSTDFANFFSENCIGAASVNDYMSQSLFTVSIKDRASIVAQIMSAKKVSRLIVTDPDNQNTLAGIVSQTDLSRTIPAFKSRTIRSVYENMELFFGSKSKPEFVEPSFVRLEDIMTRSTMTIEKDADLAEAAKMMIRQGISGLPVVELRNNGVINAEQPIGIISKSDIVKALTKE